MRGKVKWYNIEKGFGFIQTEADSSGKVRDVFTHFSELRRNGEEIKLYEGDIVEFNIKDFPKGEMATDVYVVDAGGLKEVIELIDAYKKSSDALATALGNCTVIDSVLRERVESFCLSYDEHIMLKNLKDKINYKVI